MGCLYPLAKSAYCLCVFVLYFTIGENSSFAQLHVVQIVQTWIEKKHRKRTTEWGSILMLVVVNITGTKELFAGCFNMSKQHGVSRTSTVI